LEARRNAIAGLEYKKSLAAFTKLHGIVALNSIDFEFDLWLSTLVPTGAVPRSYLFLRSPEELELSKSNMEWGTCQRACWISTRPSEARLWRRTIFLFNHNDIDGSAEGSGIDRVPCLGHGAGDGSHVLHPLGGIAMTTRWIERMAWVEDAVPGEATFCCVSPTSGQETDNNLVCMNKVLGYGGKEARSFVGGGEAKRSRLA
jgi:hypothetical protein